MGQLQVYSGMGRGGHQQMSHKCLYMRYLLVSLVPHTGINLQLPQSDLTPWTLTLGLQQKWGTSLFIFQLRVFR